MSGQWNKNTKARSLNTLRTRMVVKTRRRKSILAQPRDRLVIKRLRAAAKTHHVLTDCVMTRRTKAVMQSQSQTPDCLFTLTEPPFTLKICWFPGTWKVALKRKGKVLIECHCQLALRNHKNPALFSTVTTMCSVKGNWKQCADPWIAWGFRRVTMIKETGVWF